MADEVLCERVELALGKGEACLAGGEGDDLAEAVDVLVVGWHKGHVACEQLPDENPERPPAPHTQTVTWQAQ